MQEGGDGGAEERDLELVGGEAQGGGGRRGGARRPNGEARGHARQALRGLYQKRLAAQADWLEKQDATIARLEALVMRMQKQLPAGAGSKRAALGALPAQPTPR
jgi:hypothetical protein